MQNKLSRFLLFFLIFLVLFQWLSPKKETVQPTAEIALFAKSKFNLGKEVQVEVKNHRQTPFTLSLPCPSNPLKVERYEKGEWVLREAQIDPTECETKEVTIEPGKTQSVRFGLWNYDLFSQVGRYRVSLENASQEFEITEPGALSRFGTNVFYRPIFNTLVYLISVLPNHDLGWGIILLTLLIKVLLLGPNQNALKSQRAMQRLQPELDALKLKYKDDQQRLAQETMALWKKHKVSPVGSCLPMIIQMPILIALFYVVRDGLAVLNPDLLYAPLKSFDLKLVNVNFFGILNLTKNNMIVLPILVGGMQFLQMHLAMGKTKSQANDQGPLGNMSKTMKYMMPVMIAFFTASLPAAVGFYWGTSTLFGIGQQMVVNKMKD